MEGFAPMEVQVREYVGRWLHWWLSPPDDTAPEPERPDWAGGYDEAEAKRAARAMAGIAGRVARR